MNLKQQKFSMMLRFQDLVLVILQKKSREEILTLLLQLQQCKLNQVENLVLVQTKQWDTVCAPIKVTLDYVVAAPLRKSAKKHFWLRAKAQAVLGEALMSRRRRRRQWSFQKCYEMLWNAEIDVIVAKKVALINCLQKLSKTVALKNCTIAKPW